LKLLFDENLSPRLVRAFADEFPDSSHVTSVGLSGASDPVIWEYARTHGYTVVSKDDDFRSLSLVNGAPPKVIWIRVGNASTTKIENFIRSSLLWIKRFELSPEESLLIL
jgi:predicted nuclease of predicted toxin-antitoxin system